MHESLSQVWRLDKRTEDNIREAIVAGVTNYLARSYLPHIYRTQTLGELVESAPSIARSLVEHFNQDGSISTEMWAEKTFPYQGLDFKLHGKLDLLVETGKEMRVYDYKTKEKMSEMEIRGETKNNDGGYFRQLSFYKLLLEDKYPGKKVLPFLIFVKPDKHGDCAKVGVEIAPSDLTKLRGEIAMLLESVCSGRLITTFCDKEDCEWCALKRDTLLEE